MRANAWSAIWGVTSALRSAARWLDCAVRDRMSAALMRERLADGGRQGRYSVPRGRDTDAEFAERLKAATVARFPHCDQHVLHPSGTCEYCDLPEYDGLHRMRDAFGVNHTGERDPRKAACPAERARPLDTINRWHGNRPSPQQSA